ncbi:MAG: alpha/beta hydrolase [Chloroflexota bacterium]
MKKISAYIIEIILVVLIISMIIFVGVLVYAHVQANFVEVEAVPKPPTDTVTLTNGYDYHIADYLAVNDANPTPLVLLHPFDSRGSAVFDDQWIGNLRQNFRVIVPDMLGFGYAERVTESGAHYSYASQAAAVVEMLDTLGVTTVDILGHGYGGAVAAQLALDYPERVRRLVFVAPDIYPRETFNEIAWDVLTTAPAGMGRGFIFLSDGAGQQNPAEDARPFLIASDNSQALFNAHRERDNATLSQRLPSIIQPVAVMWSEGDSRVPVTFAARFIAVTDAETTLVLPEGTHYIYVDRQQEVNETLTDFLGQ